MPQLTELQKRLKRQHRIQVGPGTEEVLIADVRGTMRPGDFVEEKLRALNIGGASVPVNEDSQFLRKPR